MSDKIKNLWIFDENKLLIADHLLKMEGKANVCGRDLVDELAIPKNLLSYHIKILREKRVVSEKKVGKKKFYSVNKSKKAFVKDALRVAGVE